MIIIGKDDFKRIRKIGKGKVAIDFHGLPTARAVRLMHSYIEVFRPEEILAIHGFHRGTSIRDALTKKRLTVWPYSVIPDQRNKGVTRFVFRAA